MYEFCEREGIPFERCGKVIVARSDAELARLDELERRGRENQVPGLRRLSAGELAEVEPHCRGVAALHSPETGIVDFAEVARAVARELSDGGTPVALEHGIRSVRVGNGRIALVHDRGETRARFAVFCAGAGSDKLAVAAGASPDPRIVPFRGAYLYLRPEKQSLVRSMIYPVPDPSLPFLGVHLTRHIDGHVSLGPTALLAPRSLGDLLWPGTIKMGLKWWRTGITEIRHRLSQRTLARAAADYVPEIGPGDFDGGFAGKRAQALGRDGKLVDDFVVSETERALHVRNAPSPAAPSSFALARLIADRAEPGLD
jgi:2-hydroxyglutarate dehydrogenase